MRVVVGYLLSQETGARRGHHPSQQRDSLGSPGKFNLLNFL